MRAPLRAVTNEAHAAGPYAYKQAELDEDMQRVHEWRRRWRTYMSEAVLYFDDIPRDIAQSFKPYLQTLGSSIQPFFDSNVTHVVSDRQTSDVVAKARDKGIRVYSNDKLARFMHSLTGYTAPRSGDAGHAAKLDQLLENEKRQNTVNAAYARKEANFHTFRGPYILVFDPQQVNRPLAIKEWRPAAEPEEGAWPQLRLTPPGMCPFAPRPNAKASRRRQHAEPPQTEMRAKRRALVGPSAPGLAGLGLTEPERDDAAARHRDIRPLNPLMPDGPADAPAAADAPANPEAPANPANPEAPEAPEAPAVPEIPKVLGASDGSKVPDVYRRTAVEPVAASGVVPAAATMTTRDGAACDVGAEERNNQGSNAQGDGACKNDAYDASVQKAHALEVRTPEGNAPKANDTQVVRARDAEATAANTGRNDDAVPDALTLEDASIPEGAFMFSTYALRPSMETGEDDKENQMPLSAPRAGPTPSMQPSAGSRQQLVQPAQASARLREFGEIVASGVQRYSQTSAKSFAANVGPSREVANLKRKVMPPAPGPSRPRAEQKRDKPDKPTKKPGFCENCLERYEDLVEHLKGQSHVMFATNEKRFKPLNEALQRFERNRSRASFYS